MNKEEYLDKVYGGWFGKCLGGAAGAPVEGIKDLILVNDFTEIMNPNLPNDDLDLQLLWLETMEEHGLNTDAKCLADAWIKKCWYPFSEYGYFIKNYKRGILPPYSGKLNNSFFNEGFGCPIRSEIWGFLFPNKPDVAAYYAGIDGSLDHSENSVWAEQMLAAMESMLFYEKDIFSLLQIGLSFIPKESKLYNCVNLVLKCYQENMDYLKVRTLVLKKFGHSDFTNVMQNMGFIVIALLYGELNLAKTINIALKCGYDTDCTCATAGAIVGGIIGFEKIEEKYKKIIQDNFVIGIAVDRKSTKIKDLALDTVELGLKLQKEECCKNDVEIKLDYCANMGFVFDDPMLFYATIANHTSKVLQGELKINDLPENWYCSNAIVSIEPNQTLVQKMLIETKNVSELKQINSLTLTLNEYSQKFGVPSANIWRVWGPYYKQLHKKDNQNHPSPHSEGCVLPTVECMVNNEVYLNEDYEYKNDDFEIINAYEDKLPIDLHFTMHGQCLYYLEQEIYVENDTTLWMVIGNNDGFSLWVNEELVLQKDEIRLYTPYNNCELISLKKGENKIKLKLLKRTNELTFAMGLRKYEGEHWHKKEWFIDYIQKNN